MSSVSQPLNSNTLANPNTPFYGGNAPTPGSGVTSIVAGTNVTISPTTGVGAVTINATGGGGGGGVTSIVAGDGIAINPTTGVGAVTITATPGGDGSFTTLAVSGNSTLSGDLNLTGDLVSAAGKIALGGLVPSATQGIVTSLGISGQTLSSAGNASFCTATANNPAAPDQVKVGRAAASGSPIYTQINSYALYNLNSTAKLYTVTASTVAVNTTTELVFTQPTSGLPAPGAALCVPGLYICYLKCTDTNTPAGVYYDAAGMFFNDGTNWYGNCSGTNATALTLPAIIPSKTVAGGLLLVNPNSSAGGGGQAWATVDVTFRPLYYNLINF